MALQRSSPLYPVNSSTVDTGGSVDIRALLGTEAGATDATQSIRIATQGTSGERRFDPATTLDTTTLTASTSQDGKGWAIQTADMATDDPGGVAYLRAGTVTVNMAMLWTGTGTGNVGAVDALTPRASLWRWNTSTNTATLIAGASGTQVTTSALTAYTDTAVSASVAISVGSQVDFAANEVLLVVIGGLAACGAGLLGGARTFTAALQVDISTTNLTFSNGYSLSQRALRFFTGAVTPAAAIVKRAGKVFTGSATPAGVTTFRVSKVLTGSITATGTLTKRPARFFAGVITSSGQLRRTPVKLLTGTITPGPSTLTRRPTKLLTGTITPTGTVTRRVSRFFTGTITPTGAVLRRPTKFFTGTITPGPSTVIRRPTKLLTSSITPSGTIRTLLTKNFRSDLNLNGAVVRRASKFFTGTVTPTGTLRKTPLKYLTGIISGEGGGVAPIIRRIRRLIVDD